MRVTHRISTGQFEYVEVAQDLKDIAGEGPIAEMIKKAHEKLIEAFRPKQSIGLPEKEWKRFIERILQGEPNHIDELEQCSPTQKIVINEVKKALKRLEARNRQDRWMDSGVEDGRPTKSEQD